MSQNKNTITVILMISSILLLIALQIFWLRGSYEKAYHDFHRETSILFRTTVMGLRDSLFLKNVEPVEDDTVTGIFGEKRFLGRDSVFQRYNIQQERGKVKIYVSSARDSVDLDILGPVASVVRRVQIKGKPGAFRSFIVKLNPDTLNMDTLTLMYRRALSSAGFHIPFVIRHIVFDPEDEGQNPLTAMGNIQFPSDEKSTIGASVFNDTIATYSDHLNPFHQYRAVLGDVRKTVFSGIVPQVLFSVFLTVITTASFIFMFRNIQSQQRLMEAKNEFISNVTHELKTPVATVSVALEALKNFQAKDNPRLTEEYLDIAQRELNRLSILTDKILKTTIFESKGVEFVPETIDLDSMILQIMASMKMIFENHGATVIYQKQGENFELRGSPLHLTNLIYNLIDNALKYCPEKPVINILLSNSYPFLILSVKDNGIGIAKEYHTKIFEKFYRISSGDVHNTKGYGLGLSYVASVVKSHYGIIEVFSEPNHGSEFKITLPRPPGRIFRKMIKI